MTEKNMKKIFLFVNMTQGRLGAAEDANALEATFRNTLQFDQIYHFKDPSSSSKLYKCMNNLCNTKNNDIDVFVLVISGHGSIDFKGTKVHLKKGTNVSVNDIIEFITSLIELKKATIIVIINCCRIGDHEKLASEKLKKYRDIYPNLMLCYSCQPGEMSHRSKVTGSRYITELCKFIDDDHNKDMTIQKIFKKVSKLVHEESKKRTTRQTPEHVGFKEPYYLR